MFDFYCFIVTLSVISTGQCQLDCCNPTGPGPSLEDIPRFLPFGPTAGDSTVPLADDGGSPSVTLSPPFEFFGSKRSSLVVNTNGVISFGAAFTSFFHLLSFPLNTPPLIAPYWEDANTLVGNGRIYYSTRTDEESLCKAQQIIRNCDMGFVPTWVFVATWYRVTHFGGSDTSATNTFQCTLATDEVTSYVIFDFIDIGWGESPTVGVNAGDGVRFAVVPMSVNITITESVDTNIGNVDTGRWVIQVDDDAVIPDSCGCTRIDPCATNDKDLSCCVCDAFYFGGCCRNNAVSCDAPLCNGVGTCFANRNETRAGCLCDAGFTGANCETDVRCTLDCRSGTCQISPDGVSQSCVCPPFVSGPNCELDGCIGFICRNGGTCRYVNQYPTCHCASGYIGRDCEINARARDRHQRNWLIVSGVLAGLTSLAVVALLIALCGIWTCRSARVTSTPPCPLVPQLPLGNCSPNGKPFPWTSNRHFNLPW